jgi:hypothetical protein
MKIQLIAFILLLTCSCGRKTFSSNTKVEYISTSEGTVTANVLGIGKNKKEAILDAEIKLFDVLLFRGLPESEYKTALVGYNEAEIKLNHRQYFNRLYNNGRFKSFIMASTPVSEFVKMYDGSQSITMGIKINIPALMKDLEYNNIIRKFGY